MEVGKKAPDFKLPASSGETVKLSDYRGKKVVLYFYPKDNTPTCTQQACDFRDAYPAMVDSNTVVLGISPDPVLAHEKFIGKQNLPFLLLSDEKHKVCEKYGVWQLKKLYGREYMGVVRSTFLIDEKGKLVREWRGIKIKGHVQQVAEEAAKL
ncbi:thioredoxin-dependent thiol peroxidase [Paenibacillus glycanilyticus]|uniref:thioredoxin-dependent peroxiredoxin n=1 Tax=Paenibacillus glycanilyticus TaxID=126569 RepID=A0ABQ6GJB0_9BACL|nr:thioredoxin-dependent thiol peroxidase [Paenibacillus glycanilyticus]GLX70180.1 peroxiredoxin [Paenibacillus glycanilyticus]